MFTNLTITYVPVSFLKPNSQNPRKHNDRQIRLLAKSITAVGFNVPILVDRDGNVISSRRRYHVFLSSTSLIFCERFGRLKGFWMKPLQPLSMIFWASPSML